MEMLVIAVIALGAFAAVLIPLLRRRPGVGDEREFENVPPGADAAPAAIPSGAAEPMDARRPPTVVNTPPAGPEGTDPLEAEVLRYRDAVRAGTVCRKCGQANPPQSTYCSDCGARLPLADAKEFE